MTYQFKVWLADYRTGKVDTTTDPDYPRVPDHRGRANLAPPDYSRKSRPGIVCSPIVREEAGKLL